MESILEFLESAYAEVKHRRVYLLYLDALGTANLGLPGFQRKRYRTVFPASTVPFFYTFHTLLSPAEHGFLEWSMHWENEILFPLRLTTADGRRLVLGEDISEDEIFPFRSIFECLSEKGYRTVYYTPYEDQLNHLLAQGAELVRIAHLSEVFPLKDADLTVIYWDSLDYIQHRHDRDSAYRAELELLRTFIKMLSAKIPPGSVLYVFGDHGHTKCDERYLLPEIDSVVPVGGDRVAFYRDLDIDVVRERILADRIPATVYMLDEVEGFSKGYNKDCRVRYGEVVIIAEKGVGFKYPYEIRAGKTKWHISAHGGNTADEILVDVWVYRA